MRKRSSFLVESLALLAGLSCSGGGATDPSAVASVTVTSPASIVHVGRDLQMTVVVRDAHGSAISGLPVSWSSTNDSIVTVSQSGLASGHREGTASIVATAGGKSGSAILGVTFPFANIAGVWTINGAFDTPADVHNAIHGAANFIQQSRQGAGFTGNATMLINAVPGTVAGNLHDATLTEAGDIAFTIESLDGASWVFTGTLTAGQLSGRQTLTRPMTGGGTETFSGTWTAVR